MDFMQRAVLAVGMKDPKAHAIVSGYGGEEPRGANRHDLDDGLAKMRSQHGREREITLAGRALPPWMKRWAEENDVRFADEPDAPLGKAYLMILPLPPSEDPG